MAGNDLQIQTANDQSLSLIQNLNLNDMEDTINKIHKFQELVHKSLKQGYDYGIVPGSKKPTLLKPGAEKILMLLGLTGEYELIEKIHEYDTGFFAFTVRCKLFKGTQLVTEGVGHCNTKERKYLNQDSFTLANTCLKMAKKRAQIDATLTVASLSEVFTQDVEDILQPPIQSSGQQKIMENKNTEKNEKNDTISSAQAKRLFALSRGDADLCKEIISKYGYNRSGEVKKADYNKIAADIESSVHSQIKNTQPEVTLPQ